MPVRTTRRPAFSLLELLFVAGILAILGGLFLPAVQLARASAARSKSMNNMKQIVLAVHNYESTFGVLPPGADANGFSTLAVLLPYVEQDNLFRQIDFTKTPGDPANAAPRATVIQTYLSPRDPIPPAFPASGPTNYLFCAGSKTALKDNDGVFYPNSKQNIVAITDGTSNTAALGETLRGDGGTKPVTVQRQHVRLKNGEEGGENEVGVKDFADGKHVVGTRGSAWIEGRFLQSMFTGTLKFNSDKPDVEFGDDGGLSALRSLDDAILVGMCDGSVRGVSAKKVSFMTWQCVVTRAGGEVTPADWQ
jgi:type II secretory pathway pseudopilin PulG